MVRTTRLGCSALLRRMTYLLHHFCDPPISQLTQSDLEDFLATALVCLPRSPLLPDISEFVLEQDLEVQYHGEPYKDQFFEWKQPSEGLVKLPTWIRFAIPEVLFEPRDIYADPAYNSITTCITSAHKSAGVDLQEPLKRICITGGLCQIPGLQHRIRAETGLDVLSNPFASELAWVGASLASSMKLDGQTVTIQQFNSTSKVPDWTHRLQ